MRANILIILKQLIYTGFLLYLLPVISQGQTVFYSIIGDEGSDIPYSIINTSDGNLVLAFASSSSTSSNENISLVKISQDGVIIWKKRYGGVSRDFPRSVIQTSDGGYAVLGSTSSFGSGNKDFLLLKTDNLGNLEWAKTYGGDNQERGFTLRQTPEGGFILGGSTQSFSNGNEDAYVIKTDNIGNVEWSTSFGGFSTDNCFSFQITEEGDFLFTGSQGSFGPGVFGYWVIKLSSQGALQWIKTYGGNDEEHSRIIEKTNDGNFLVFGHTTTYGQGSWDFLVIKIDPEGNLLWSKTYGGVGTEFAGSVTKKNNGNFLLTAHTSSFGQGGDDISVIEIDEDGELIWAKTYGDNGSQQLPFGQDFGCVVTPDNGLIILGQVAGPFGGNDIMLIKTTGTGENECIGETFLPIITSPSLQSPNLDITSNSGAIANSANISVVDENIQIELQCGEPPIANFELSQLTICQGECITIENLSENTPTETNWSFPGGEPTSPSFPVNGELCYPTPGIYPVTLIVSNTFGSDTLTQEITVVSAPELYLGSDTSLCPGSTLLLDATVPEASNYLWQDGSTAATFLVETEGVFSVEVSLESCIATDEINVTFENDNLESFSLGVDTTLCLGEDLELNVSISDVMYQWQDGSNAPFFLVEAEGAYSITVTNDCGSATDDIVVSYEDCSCDIYIPNVFSPNNDGVNDIFQVLTDCPNLETFHLLVFNRWGGIVFESASIDQGWNGKVNGKIAASDVYVYLIKYSFRENGESKQDQESGDLTLLR